MPKNSTRQENARPDCDRVTADLEALIVALDRRVPRIERAGERKIAADASVLKEAALVRLKELRSTQK
ncbi:MAG: hypothetical protein KJ066_00225 [Acidobacteria bacterium]|nr:hypothetical protein [Acidobacteriota bacterium]